MRQAAKVAQIVGEVRVIGAKLALPRLDALFKVVALGAQVVQAGHCSGPFAPHVANAGASLKGTAQFAASYSAEMSFPV